MTVAPKVPIAASVQFILAHQLVSQLVTVKYCIVQRTRGYKFWVHYDLYAGASFKHLSLNFLQPQFSLKRQFHSEIIKKDKQLFTQKKN